MILKLLSILLGDMIYTDVLSGKSCCCLVLMYSSKLVAMDAIEISQSPYFKNGVEIELRLTFSPRTFVSNIV